VLAYRLSQIGMLAVGLVPNKATSM